jgi:hypothetical protein
MPNSPFRTVGGVAPFKKKSKARKVRAGKVGKKATATRAQDKSGYSRSGKDYVNVHSFTANTRLSQSLSNTLGPSISPAVQGKGNNSMTPQMVKDILGDMWSDQFTVEYIGGPDDKLSKQASREDEFKKNCYDANGVHKPDHTYTSEIDGQLKGCKLDADYKPVDRSKIKSNGGGKAVVKNANGEIVGEVDVNNKTFEHKMSSENDQ